MQITEREEQDIAATRPTRIRHVILGLTVTAYAITYMDRVVMSVALPVIQRELGLSLITMGWILSTFRWGYALFQIPGGWFGDRIGPRKSLALIVAWWSCFTSATALAWNAASMAVFRGMFGMGEAGAFPIATRSLSRWTLATERGYAQGLCHAGSRLGAALTPPLVVALIGAYGWRSPFFLFGVLGLIWAAAWYGYYRDYPEEHSGTNKAERELIAGSAGATGRSGRAVPWGSILANPNVWILCAMYWCYGYTIAVYIDWFPKYLSEHRGFDLKRMGLYAGLLLAASALGDLLGGWISDLWAKRTGNLRYARRVVGASGFLLAAAAMLPATFTTNPRSCVALSCLAAFALELTVGVSWAIPLDIGGDCAGSVAALMNTCGSVGGALSPAVLAYLVQAYGWDAPFVVTVVLCLLAALLISRVDAGKRIAFERSFTR